MYECSQCKLAVIVIDGKIIKACTCEAPVTMSMSATAQGKGGVKTRHAGVR